jgi:hypothetical protein
MGQVISTLDRLSRAIISSRKGTAELTRIVVRGDLRLPGYP